MAVPKRSPTPFRPVVAFTLPAIHCMAPACTVTGERPTSQITWRLRMFISLQK